MFLPLPHVLKKQSSQSYKQDSKQQCRGVQHKEVPSQMGLYKPFAAMSTFVMRPLSNLGSKSLTWSNSEGNSKISINVSNIDETHVFFSIAHTTPFLVQSILQQTIARYSIKTLHCFSH